MQIEVAPGVSIDDRAIEVSFIQASGPGGQNVNKVASAVQLRFDASSLPAEMRDRLQSVAGSRLSRDGVVVINARRFRSQQRNRQDALERLNALIREAAERPIRRVPTRRSLGARRRRLEAKARRASVKRTRGAPDES